MSVINNVDLDYIHNEIAMDNSHDAINIIVEGMTDAKLMEDFTIEDKCSVYHVDSRDKWGRRFRHIRSIQTRMTLRP